MGWASALCPENLWSYGFSHRFSGVSKGFELWTSDFAEIVEPLYTIHLWHIYYPRIVTFSHSCVQVVQEQVQARAYLPASTELSSTEYRRISRVLPIQIHFSIFMNIQCRTKAVTPFHCRLNLRHEVTQASRFQYFKITYPNSLVFLTRAFPKNR
jgi:hypothetical protein